LARVLVLLGACAAVIAGTAATAAAHPASTHVSVSAHAGHQSATPSPNDWWW
jgi:hypothetical protein